ncbi:SdpA family antimicrobial peptide system protein [Aquimarina sp. I32.4]|uniref:SdpA family antimicrobial peptide system protein n=1 Tax=Aquimarina sp. I32.4 TaxID=2053903 RepID=UPI000CDF04CB|nr:SdpA family antimicrobial peptide system protein [Aquimarina sp. I32.4]
MKLNRKKSIVLLGLIPSFLTLIIVFKTSFNSPLVSSSFNKINTVNVLPQGWAFFTKSPRDVRVELIDGKTNKNISLKNFSLTNFFGLKRTSTRITTELGMLIKETPDSLWVKTNGISNDFEKGNYIIRKSHFKKPYLSEKIILINKERVPWAWSNFNERKIIPITYLKIKQIAKSNSKHH